MNTPITDTDLHAWLDGELTTERRAEIDAWLHSHPDDAARVRLWAADRELLRPLDTESRRVILKSAKRVSTVTALSPIMWIAMGFVLVENVRAFTRWVLYPAWCEAMRALDQRTNVPEVRSFVLAILQADTFGVSISRLLRSQADEMRIKRRLMAQEKAQKAPVKMLFPLAVCIFPAVFVIVLLPAIVLGTIAHQDDHLRKPNRSGCGLVDNAARCPQGPPVEQKQQPALILTNPGILIAFMKFKNPNNCLFS